MFFDNTSKDVALNVNSPVCVLNNVPSNPIKSPTPSSLYISNASSPTSSFVT